MASHSWSHSSCQWLSPPRLVRDHMTAQTEAQKIISPKQVRVLPAQQTPYPRGDKRHLPSHRHMGCIWGPCNPVPLNVILSRSHWDVCHGQPAEHSTALRAQRGGRAGERAALCMWTSTLPFLGAEAHRRHTHKECGQVAGGTDRKERLRASGECSQPHSPGNLSPQALSPGRA